VARACHIIHQNGNDRMTAREKTQQVIIMQVVLHIIFVMEHA
jgi:hypothetical protein